MNDQTRALVEAQARLRAARDRFAADVAARDHARELLVLLGELAVSAGERAAVAAVRGIMERETGTGR